MFNINTSKHNIFISINPDIFVWLKFIKIKREFDGMCNSSQQVYCEYIGKHFTSIILENLKGFTFEHYTLSVLCVDIPMATKYW